MVCVWISSTQTCIEIEFLVHSEPIYLDHAQLGFVCWVQTSKEMAMLLIHAWPQGFYHQGKRSQGSFSKTLQMEVYSPPSVVRPEARLSISLLARVVADEPKARSWRQGSKAEFLDACPRSS